MLENALAILIRAGNTTNGESTSNDANHVQILTLYTTDPLELSFTKTLHLSSRYSCIFWKNVRKLLWHYLHNACDSANEE